VRAGKKAFNITNSDYLPSKYVRLYVAYCFGFEAALDAGFPGAKAISKAATKAL
jgi:hypothetical protein